LLGVRVPGFGAELNPEIACHGVWATLGGIDAKLRINMTGQMG
jgi:hypothetical protein